MTKTKWFPTLAAVAALALVSAAPPHYLPPCIHTPYEGITETAADGTVIGEPDARDWGCVEHGRGTGHGAAELAAPTRVRRAPAEPVTDAGPVGVGPPLPPPTEICMSPAAPNPASVATRIQFALPANAQVSLAVYGRRPHGPGKTFIVRTLLDAALAAGFFSFYWDLSDDQGDPLPPGTYRVVLVVGEDALCGDIEVR